ncbi:MAG: tetratricopeptide repeat protein [Treponema sp.]|jgi:tetratricopeptide (TPR) repeat protein|nr:tetratricopeptide repeat protein [Treponema sp.]
MRKYFTNIIAANAATVGNIVAVMIVTALALLAVSCAKTPNAETIRLYVLASEAYAAGKFDETVEILDKEKKFVPAMTLRAKAEYFSGDFERAENTCRRAIKLNPSSFEAKLYLARILRDKSGFDDASLNKPAFNETALNEAVQLTESLLSDNPQDIRALRLAAALATEKGKNDEAAAYLDRAAEFSAESALVLLDRARLRWVSGKAPQALEDLSRARAMLPWDTPLLRSITNLENIIKEVM